MPRFTSFNGIELIKSFEGFRDVPYYCASGILTIGYGHVISQKEHYHSISEYEGEELLKRDLLRAELAVINNIDISLSQNQFDALVSLTFNIGGGALQRSSIRQKINRKASIEEIKNEFLRWVHIKGRIIQALVKRRKIESEIYIM